jgi:CRISPR-associated protein Cas7/Cst2/DevR subtype I-B
MYVTALFISNPVLAANNRGEGTGNLQTLQRITTPTGSRTVLSGYAIKRAMRDNMLASGANMWRRNDDSDSIANPAGYVYGENNSPTLAKATPDTPAGYADAQFGFMKAEKDKGEQAVKQKGALEVSVAISTTNDVGDLAFAQGLKAKAPLPNPFGAERHYTRYQFTVTWDLNKVDAASFSYAANALRSLAVGGSHSSNATEITPDQVLWTLHRTPGRAGLQIGMGDIFPPDEALDLTSIQTRAEELGVSFNGIHLGVRGKAIDEMIAAATPYCKQA